MAAARMRVSALSRTGTRAAMPSAWFCHSVCRHVLNVESDLLMLRASTCCCALASCTHQARE
jgi:hypothetical protein